MDQIRNGNRWVAAIDTDTNRLAAERLTDNGRAVFEKNYLRDHVTLGHAATVHSAQAVTADSSYAVLGERAPRAMLHVAMTHGRHNNEAFLYQKLGHEADHEHAKPVSATRSINCAATTNTPPPTISNRFCITTSGPARCTPRPNAPSAACFGLEV